MPGLTIYITPKVMAAQWAGVSHKFQFNLWNFEVEAARAAVKTFQQSFDMRRFNTQGSSPWAPRKRNYKHPILEETGTLKNSIVWKRQVKGVTEHEVQIYTDPSRFGTAKRHPGFCYAAIHNSPSSLGLRTGKAANIQQRQFMGSSTVLDQEIKKLIPTIFKGFP